MSRTLQPGETVGPFTVEIPREMWLGLEFDAWLGWRRRLLWIRPLRVIWTRAFVRARLLAPEGVDE